MFDGLRTWFQKARQVPVQELIALETMGRPQWTPRNYASLAKVGFSQNAVAYRCVRIIAECAASVPFSVFEAGRRVHDHPLVKMLSRPNPEQSGPELMEAVYGFLQTAGNAYLELGQNDHGGALYTLRPDRVKVVPGLDGWPEAYDYDVDGRSTRISKDGLGRARVLHLKLFHPLSDWYGFSPLEAAAAAIDLHNAAGAWNKALLDNAARPSGALVHRGDVPLSSDQFDRLKTQLSEAYQGAMAAGRPLLLEGGLEFRPMSLSPAEMDHLNGRAMAAREIALAFGVPSQIIGLPGDATYANYAEANGAFWRQTISPLVAKTAKAISSFVSAYWPGVEVRADVDQVPALAAERESLWQSLDTVSFLSTPEKRQIAGLEVAQ